MTVTDVLGQGRQKGVTEIYRGAKEAGGLLNKVRLDIAVNEAFVEPTIVAITKGAHTGQSATVKFLSWSLPNASASAPANAAEGPLAEVIYG